jgi:hypothetical protein
MRSLLLSLLLAATVFGQARWAMAVSVPGHALRGGPENIPYKPLAVATVRVEDRPKRPR